ncbi:HAD hydrolase-like protein, partial [Candidatus Peregrinibacteria bacterium]|nr:HAD hydrolase-like protein [Candidatus Peregrinibacteria bacterium]
MNYFSVVDGAQDVLHHLRKNKKKTALVSTKSREGVDFMLKVLAWENLVDYSVSGNCVANLKPHPEPLINALEYFQVASKDALFIGDSFHDLHASRAAKVDFIGVLSGVCNEDDWKRERVEYFESVKVLI